MKDDKSDDEIQQVVVGDLAVSLGFADAEFVSVYKRVCNAIRKEFGSTSYSGIGMGIADVGFEHNNVVYQIDISPKKSLKAAS